MKYLKISFLFAFSLTIIVPKGNAQEVHINNLHIGDHVPDIPIIMYSNENAIKTSLEEYKGRLLIFDFWGVYCSACITSLPHIQELQEQFQKEIKIILVTSDTEDQVKALWKRLDVKEETRLFSSAGRKLPVIVNDTIIKNLFPHTGQPTHAIIDTNQCLIAVTGGVTTNVENIYSILHGAKVNFFDEINFKDININNPLTWIRELDNKAQALQYYSFVIKGVNFGYGGACYDPVMWSQIIDSSSSRIIGVNYINNTIIGLYKAAYQNTISENQDLPTNRMVIKTKNRYKFYIPAEANYFKWGDSNTYCYALKVPLSLSGKLFAMMRRDLDAYFNMKSKVEYRKVNCIILKENENFKKKKPGIRKLKFKAEFDREKKVLVLENAPLKLLYYHLDNLLRAMNSSTPFLDKTTIKGNISIELPWDEDFRKVPIYKIREKLKSEGLDLKKMPCDLKMLVISEND